VNHFRIASYDIVKGTSKEVAELALGPGGINEIYRSMPGFQAYSLIEVDPVTIIGLTAWETHDEAEAATRAAAEWVATHLDGRIHRTNNFVGDSLLWEGVVK
jgi:heme-degrading monooxygenase HmoA